MKTIGRIVGMLLLLAVGVGIFWFAYARPMASTNAMAMQEQLAATQERLSTAETRVKELVDNPVRVTEVITREVPTEKIVEVTKVVTVEVSGAGSGLQVPLTVATVVTPTCRHIEWFTDAREGALNTTTDVAGLLAKLDRDFQLAEGGQWSNAGFTVPANTVFWTDLLNHELPSQVERIRTQGNWGIYKTSAGYTVPSPNGGGRFLQVCEDVASLPAQTVEVVTDAPSAKPADKPVACITDEEVSVILKATDPVVAYNTFFEGKGYQFGKGLNPGDKINAGFYLGTFPVDNIPATVINLANGFLWQVNAETTVQGGRWMSTCK